MSDKDNATPVSAADAGTPQTPAAPAVAEDKSKIEITVVNQINMAANPRAAVASPPAASGKRSAGTRSSSRSTDGAGQATRSSTPNGPGIDARQTPSGRAPVSGLSSVLEASGGHHYIDHINGDERHTLIDKDGSKIVVVRDSDTGHTKLTFDDTRARFTTESDEPGFVGQRRLPHGYGGIRNVRMDVSPSATFNSATIYCQDNVPALSWSGVDFDTTTTTNADVSKLTVRELKEFTNRNPELGAELRSMRFTTGAPVIVTEADGRSISAAALNQLKPPAVQACPTGRDDDYKGIVVKR